MTKEISSLTDEGAVRAVAAVRTSPSSLYLTPAQWLVLSRIIYLSTRNALERQKMQRYCTRQRTYFANSFKLGIYRISRITSLLEKKDMITKFQSRPLNGKFQQNIYKLEGRIWAIVKTVIARFLNKINRVRQSAHIVLEQQILTKTSEKKEDSFKNYSEKSPPDWLKRLSEKFGFEEKSEKTTA